jgi:rhomboid protease GluP
MKEERMTYNHDENNEDFIDKLRKGQRQWVSIAIIIINIAIFTLVEMTGSSDDVGHMLRWGASYPEFIRSGEYYRLFTCMFLHFGIEHLINNMVLSLFIGDFLEKAIGKIRYLIIYLIGGIGSSTVSYLISIRIGHDAVSAGASGAVFAVIGALLYLLLRNHGQVEGLSFKRLAIMSALSLYVGFTSGGVDNSAHVGGLLCGILLSVLLYRKKTGNLTVNVEP